MTLAWKHFLLITANVTHAARLGGRDVRFDIADQRFTAKAEKFGTAERESDVKPEMIVPLAQKLRIPAVVNEGMEMTFRDPVSVQLLQAEVPKGVRRGEPFFVWVRQPDTADGRATVVWAERISDNFVPIAEPVLEVENKEFNSLSIGERDEPLLPDLSSAKGGNYSFDVLEQVSIKDGLIGDRSKFNVIQRGIGNVLRFEGKSKSSFAGHSTIKAYDRQNKTVFKMRMQRHNWLPGRWTWRVLAPNSQTPLFTLTKSIFGTGALWMRSVWHIYKGRKRDGKLAYFCKGDYLEDSHAGKVKCYWSATETKHPLATLMQKPTIGAYTRDKLIPDEYSLEVRGGEDAGLFLAWAVLHDYTKDELPFTAKMAFGAYVGTVGAAAIF